MGRTGQLPAYPYKWTLCGHFKKNATKSGVFDSISAERTGLEPATSYVTGRRSNQLNYRSIRTYFVRAYNLILPAEVHKNAQKL